MTHWFFDTAGIGSIIVFTVGISVFIGYVRMLLWIRSAPPRPAEPTVEVDDAAVEQAK